MTCKECGYASGHKMSCSIGGVAVNVQTPWQVPNKVALLGPVVEGFTVGQWCQSRDGTGKPTAVAVVFNVRSLGDVVLRLHSRRAVDETIQALIEHRDAVFGKKS